MQSVPNVDAHRAGFWRAVGAALAALAKRSGCSLFDSPLPEIREAAHDWRNSADARSAGLR
jgi:hypothetical protein